MKVFLRKRLWFFGLLIIMQLFSSFLAAYPIKIITVIINDLGSDFHMSKKFYIYVIVFLMCELLYFWLSNLVTYLYAKAQSELAAEYRDYLYNRMLKKDMSFFDSRSMSDIDGLIMFDSEIIAQGEIALINYSAKTIFSLGFTLYFMFRLSIPLTLIVLPFGIALGIYSSKSSRLFERLSKDNRRRNTKLWNVCQESIKGIREIKVNNYYHEYESLFGNVNKEVFKNNTNTWLYKFKCEFFNGVFLTIMLGVVIMMGAFYVSNDAISIGAFVALFTYCSNLATPIQSIVFMALDLSKCNASKKRIEIICSDDYRYVDKEKEYGVSQGLISLENVSFAYQGRNDIICNLSFVFNGGNRYAIVGETGSGKSTIIKLICNLYRPTEGQINIYGNGCTDALIAEYISVVFQDTFLINGTIRDNIIFYRDDVSQSRLDDIIRICCLDELVSKLCDGLDTYIGENGVMLSGGERQRIGIARALVQNKPVLLLDEATSALDNTTQDRIMNNIKNAYHQKLVIIVAHRLSTIVDCDEILVMNHGKIIANGAHTELMNSCSLYCSMYEASLKKEKSQGFL